VEAGTRVPCVFKPISETDCLRVGLILPLVSGVYKAQSDEAFNNFHIAVLHQKLNFDRTFGKTEKYFNDNRILFIGDR